MHITSEMAPASGVPRLRSASGRARPIRVAGQRCLPRPCWRRRPIRATRRASRFRTPRRTRLLRRMVRARRPSSCRRGSHHRVQQGRRVLRATRRPHPGQSACPDRRACDRRRTAPRPTTRPTCRLLSLPRPRPIPNRFRIKHSRGDRPQRVCDVLTTYAGRFVGLYECGRRNGVACGSMTAFAQCGCGSCDLALSIGRRIGRGAPQPLQFLVEPRHCQRAPGHVEAGDKFTDFGLHYRESGRGESSRHRLPDHEQFLVLGPAQPIEDDRDVIRCTRGCFSEDAVDKQCWPVRRRWACHGWTPRARRGCPDPIPWCPAPP